MSDTHSSTPLRWGIIAPGRIAHRFAQAFESIENGTLYAVASRNEERLHAFADHYNIDQRYTDYQAIVDDPNVDIVYIATPHRFHCDIAELAIKANKHVLCEKPLTVNRAQSAFLFDLAAQHQVFIMEALWSRFLPAWQQVKQWVDEGRIGKLKTFESSFGFKPERNVEDRLFNLELAGGALLDTGVYNIALSDFLLDQAPNVVESDVTVGDTGIDEECKVTLTYHKPDHSIKSHFTCSFLAPLNNTFEIIGTKGSILVSNNFWEAETVSLTVNDGEKVHTTNSHFPYDKNGFEYQIREAQNCLQQNRLTSKNMSPTVTLRNMRVADCILKSAGVTFPFL